MHEGKITRLSAEQMASYLEARVKAISLPLEVLVAGAGFGDEPVMAPNPEYAAKVQYETNRAQEGWEVVCSCGWAANNPIVGDGDVDGGAAAEQALAEHYSQSETSVVGLGDLNV